MDTSRKIFKQIVAPLMLFLVIASVVLMVAVPANVRAAGDAIKPSEIIKVIGDPTKLPGYQTNAHAQASVEQGASNLTSVILYVVDLVKYVMGTVAVVFIIISGIRLLTARIYIEEVVTKQKEHLLFSTIGLIIIIMADVFIKRVFYGEQGEVYRTQTDLQEAAIRGSDLVKSIYNLVEYFAAGLAILMIIIAGFRLVVNGSNEDAQGKAKKQIMYAIIGLVVMGIAEFVVKDIIFPKQGSTLSDIEKGKQLIVTLTNFVSGFLATISAIMYIYGGYLYVIAFGKEDGSGNAKKVFTGATIGLLIAMAAFGIVNTLIKLEPTSGVSAAGSSAPSTLPTQPR